jgi:hypothetical protein
MIDHDDHLLVFALVFVVLWSRRWWTRWPINLGLWLRLRRRLCLGLRLRRRLSDPGLWLRLRHWLCIGLWLRRRLSDFALRLRLRPVAPRLCLRHCPIDLGLRQVGSRQDGFCRSTHSWPGLDLGIRLGSRVCLRRSVVPAKFSDRPRHDRRRRKFYPWRLGFQLLPLLAESLDLLPVLRKPVPLCRVHRLESQRAVGASGQLVERRGHCGALPG